MSVTVVMAGDRLRGDGETKQGRRSVKSSAPAMVMVWIVDAYDVLTRPDPKGGQHP